MASRSAKVLEVAEPIVTVKWVEEEIHESDLKVIETRNRTVVSVIDDFLRMGSL